MSTRPARATLRTRTSSSFPAGDAVTVQQRGTELRLAGELDLADAGRIPLAVEDLCRLGYRRVQLDLDAVTFIDCSAVRAFVNAFERAREYGCTVVLTGVHDGPRRVLRLFALDTVLVERRPSDE